MYKLIDYVLKRNKAFNELNLKKLKAKKNISLFYKVNSKI